MVPSYIAVAALVAVALGVPAEAASVVGGINFTSGPDGGIILQKADGAATTDISVATGVKSWLLPEVDNGSGSFSNPVKESVTIPLAWIFTPSTPLSPLWTIAGPDDFAFHLSSSVVELRSSFLFISGTGTLTGTNFDPTPAIWLFSTQGVPTDGKYSWSSSTTAIPELGISTMFSVSLLAISLHRRRITARLTPK
jgi:hypothetical protein